MSYTHDSMKPTNFRKPLCQALPLGSIAKIRAGYQALRGVESSSDGSHFIIQARDVAPDVQINIRNLTRFSPERKPENYLVSQGDILYLAKGVRHFAAWVDKPMEHVLASGAFYILRPQTDIVLPGFLAWWLNQAPVRSALKSRVTGTNLPFVSKQQLEELTISVPPLATQRDVIRINALFQQERLLTEHLIRCREKLVSATCAAACHSKE